MVRSGVKYVVLSPRAGQFESTGCEAPEQGSRKGFVVAPDEETALEIAELSTRAAGALYVDDELKDNLRCTGLTAGCLS